LGDEDRLFVGFNSGDHLVSADPRVKRKTAIWAAFP
jgi:hypothetical protein